MTAAAHAVGPLVLLDAPLSFWGGYDAATGRIIDAGHPQHGLFLAGTILAMPQTKGSSSASSVFAEAIRRGTAPAAVLLGRPCGILATGALVADALYGKRCPVLVLPQWPPAWPAGTRLLVTGTGEISLAA